MRGIVKGGNNNGGGTSINIYTQPTEPLQKEGIWLKTPTSNKYKNVAITNSLFREKRNIPNSLIEARSHGGCVPFNDKIYIFGGNRQETYIYDTVKNNYIKVANIPGGSRFGYTIADNEIYTFGSYATDRLSTTRVYDISTDTWGTNKAELPFDECSLASVTVGKKIYCIGGETDSTVSSNVSLYIYDITTDTWSVGSPMPYSRQSHGAVELNGKIYVIGGYSKNHGNYTTYILIYDIASNTWSIAGARLPVYASFAVCVVINNEIYCATSNGEILKYNHINDTLSIVTNFPIKTSYFQCTKVNGNIYIFGGIVSATNISDVQVYDTLNNTWSINIVPPTSKGDFGSVVIGDDIYCIAGMLGTSSYRTSSIYNVVSGTWRNIADYPTTVHHNHAIYYKDKIYVFGNNYSTTKDVYAYDMGTNIWSKVTVEPTKRYDAEYGIIGSKVYCMGGKTSATGSTGISQVDIYDIETNTWSTGSVMPNSGGDFGLVEYGNKIYCIGGSASSSFADVRIYDTTTDTWSSGTNMPSSGTVHGAVVSGMKIYIATLYKWYIYDITSNTWSEGESIPYSTSNAEIVIVKDKIYIFSGSRVDTMDVTYDIKSPTSNSIVLLRLYERIGKYFTQLFSIKLDDASDYNTRLLTPFDDIWVYEDNQYKEYPCYYGDGTKWIKFKN